MAQKQNNPLNDFSGYDPDDLLGQGVKRGKERSSKKEEQPASLEKKNHEENYDDDFL